MYFDGKEVLNLNRIYAAAIVYNAMRVAQGKVAEAAVLAPEAIWPPMFYPKLAAACYTYLLAQQWERDPRRRNPRTRFRMLDW